MLTSSGLKALCEGMIKDLQTAKDPLQTLGTAKADVRLVGSQSSQAKVRGFTIESDEPRTGGGEDKAPNPLDYFMSSIGFCENVILARHAALYGLTFDSLETSVRGHWDRKGQFEIDETDPSFKDISIETKITTNDPIDAVAKVIRIAHRRCPMYATVTKAAKVTTRLVVNGKDVAL
jgi:uncharacterized OsmC-like protein